MQEYTESYCAIDVYLLAEVFMQFRLETIKNFKIDPCHYLSLPGLSYDCFMKKSGIELEALTSGKKYSFLF